MTTPPPVHAPDPERARRSRMAAFTRFVAERTGRDFPDHAALHRFSVAQTARFWELFREWAAPVVEGDPDPALVGDDPRTARFFPGLRLGYAENLLADRPGAGPDADALVAASEAGETVRWTRGELRARVARAAAGLRGLGVDEGDRVAAIARSTAGTVVAALAAAEVGATWSAVAPDLGADAVLARFRQLRPKVLFAHGTYPMQGLERSARERVAEVADGLPSLAAVVSLDGDDPGAAARPDRPVVSLPAWLAADAPADPARDVARAAAPGSVSSRRPFDHPLLVLFSSGTTGPPKALVHGAGGTLLEHRKEHELHGDLGPGDRLFFPTTAGWMMWNWQLSALATGATIVLRDGSATWPEPDSLWRFADEQRVTVLGTSPAFLQYSREAALEPNGAGRFEALRAVQSTGAVLADDLFTWVRDRVKDVPVQSISGGTDIVGCFVLGHPGLPVWAGESQCISLGLDVQAWPDDAAEAADAAARPRGVHPPATEVTGELVCTNPFPSRPIGLLDDPDGTRFRDAYFVRNPGVWTHGDRIRLTPRGTARMLGRSDGVMNLRGIRVGPAEVTSVADAFPEIARSMAIEQRAPREPGGSRMVLLVVMADGTALDRPLTLRLKKALSVQRSAVHVPSVVAAVDDLPETFSGKLSERAARDAANGDRVANLGALRNPDSVAAIAAHPALRLPGAPATA